MAQRKLTLTLLTGCFAICRLPPVAAVPDWAMRSGFFSITRTPEELSIICEQAVLPPAARMASLPDLKVSKDWRTLKFEGPFEFSEVGVLASVIAPLAEAGISISAVSTFDTDYLFVQETAFARAQQILTAHGHALRA